jgi:hypothetical protein
LTSACGTTLLAVLGSDESAGLDQAAPRLTMGC